VVGETFASRSGAFVARLPPQPSLLHRDVTLIMFLSDPYLYDMFVFAPISLPFLEHPFHSYLAYVIPVNFMTIRVLVSGEWSPGVSD